jgi:hypothetical protein
MSIYDLQTRFWQLHAEQSFKPSDSHLYFYLVNQFNAARWPDKLYRKRNQVAADSGLDVKTVDTARARLQERGLIVYDPGDQSKSATWSLCDGCESGGRNSLPPEKPSEMKGNFSLPITDDSAKPSEMKGKNSLPYKEEEKTSSREEEKTPQKKEGAGATEISSPAESQKLITAPTPVAAPPAPAAAAPLGTVAPCLSPGTDASRALAAEMAAYWHIREGLDSRRWAQFGTFTRTLAAAGRLDEVRQQFTAYKAFRELRGFQRHGIDKILGSEGLGYANSALLHEGSWVAQLAEAQATKPKASPYGPAETPARSSFSRSKSQENR